MKLSCRVLIAGALLLPMAFAQSAPFDEVPASYHDHPELGLPLEGRHSARGVYELVHLRTANSKVILNDNRTRTTVVSSLPLHYQDERGHWLSLHHELTRQGTRIQFPSQQPSFVVDEQRGSLRFIGQDQQQLAEWTGSEVVLSSRQRQPLGPVHRPAGDVRLVDRVSLAQQAAPVGLEISRQFMGGAVLNSYVFEDPAVFEADFEQLLIAEPLVLPAGFSLAYGSSGDSAHRDIRVLDDQGLPVLKIHPPVAFDGATVGAKFRDQYAPYQPGIHFEQSGPSSYTVSIALSAAWIQDPERVYPLVTRSVVTLENNDLVNSCFAPAFHSSALTVAVPAGETVLWTDIEYDFVAVNQGWISDQRSYLSGPNAETGVYAGSADAGGTQTYDIGLSQIGNGVSPGSVEYVFHASRTWGGSGCNPSYNFINRRLMAVTYGTVEFGDGPIMINEYSASNLNFNDGFLRTEDWIEIYNADPDQFFNLEGFHLSNSLQDPTQWRIANGIIPPGGHLIVFASGRDISSGMVQHANFRLSQLRPDQIVLADPDGQVLESHTMQVTQLNHSYGRTEDGASDWGLFVSPSPGSANSNAFTAYAARPQFSVGPGSYSSGITLAMQTSGGNEVIRFTTDGSTPDLSASVYTDPILVDQTTVVRARAFSDDPGVLPGFIETSTYLIGEDISLPVFSFSGDQDLRNLFGGNASLRPVGHFEFFEADGHFVDGNFGDFNKHGNDSWSYPQRGVDFISRDEYGYQRRLEHKFFETSDRTRFRRLMVKAAANDNYPFENGGAHIRDSFIQHLSQVAGLDLDERSSRNVLVFLNGEYWGVYDLRERVDDNNFTDHYYGQDYLFRESDVHLQFLKTWGGTEAFFGNQPAILAWNALRQYVQNNDMAAPEHIAYVRGQLNIASLIDYFVINSWVVSRDWLNYNTGWWRGLDPSGAAREWRYILWDMEAALGHFVNYTNLPNPGPTAPPCQAEQLNVGAGHTQILRKLITQNAEVRDQYVSRYIDLLNTHLSSDKAIGLLDSMIADIAPEMPRHIGRWGGNINQWQNNVQAIRNFIETRNDYLMNTGLAACYDLSGPYHTTVQVLPEGGGAVRLNAEWLPDYPFDARLFGNIVTRLDAQPSPGYSFSHWEVNGVPVPPGADGSSIELMVSGAGSVTAHFDPPANEGELLFYWHFNELDTPEDVTTIEPDYRLVPGSAGLMRYIGTGPRDIDVNETGSDLNLHLGEPAGTSARVRNPSADRALVFDLPTSGYRDINFSYAVERTNNGMLAHHLSYSIDGINFIQEGLANTEFQLDSPNSYHLINLDFSSIAAAANNANFKIRVEFEGNTTGTSGNNRFDNITLKGIPVSDGTASGLGFGSINGGQAIYAGEPFFVLVQALDEDGSPVLVSADTVVSIGLEAGSGSLSGSLSGMISAGSQSALVDGIVYDPADPQVVLSASAAGLAPAVSEAFSVLQRSYPLLLTRNVLGAGTVSGGGSFAAGEPVVISALLEDGFSFEGWRDGEGQVVSSQATFSFDMPAAELSYTAHFGLAEHPSLIHYWHFNALEAGDLETVPADFSLVGSGIISYPGVDPETPAGWMDRRTYNAANPVSNFNLLLDQQADSGAVLRVRNPSSERMLRIEAPSTGYRDIVISFATTRTNNGAQQQALFYSADAGETWVSLSEAYAVATIGDEGYLARTFNLSGLTEADDNPDLVFKLRFSGPAAAGDDGNNRFDNLSVHGVSITAGVDPLFSDQFQALPD